jgi:hypothetical protein
LLFETVLSLLSFTLCCGLSVLGDPSIDSEYIYEIILPSASGRQLLFVLLLIHCLAPGTLSQFNEPPGSYREQTYAVLEFENSNLNQRFDGPMRHYCTFRGKWSEERHPIDFPQSPS